LTVSTNVTSDRATAVHAHVYVHVTAYW